MTDMDKIMEVLFPEETQRRKEGKCEVCSDVCPTGAISIEIR